MRIESKLVHFSEDKVIVQVNGWLNDKNVGSALAGGATVELAEDSAILRLKKRAFCDAVEPVLTTDQFFKI